MSDIVTASSVHTNLASVAKCSKVNIICQHQVQQVHQVHSDEKNITSTGDKTLNSTDNGTTAFPPTKQVPEVNFSCCHARPEQIKDYSYMKKHGTRAFGTG